ncbi:Naphthalene 1,2-dioxygenase system ferredoxin subunit [Novipirellula galeiformis]|uniref:Naphthalene 1,2-dioxygenase system ferredoxin subunit n=1 Tax=Novipirellula galeiformis TaxID=2528004 RepID=A0A5C6CG05_9BACT|nr:Rieske 2Fe-2S domain-containing protein [Novipirellula galeiformis]TWU21639.1 Naphthalene 1,2-dioxygenase system ferredoxin subunit [Novipirellula galeiformis]
MGQWIDVAALEDCGEGKAIEVLVEGQVIAIFQNEGELFALDGMCAHQGGPIAQGHVAGGCVTCPWHGWQYELATGIQTINRQPLQKTFAVRQRDGRIEIDI